MEAGQCSGTNAAAEDDVWARLVGLRKAAISRFLPSRNGAEFGENAGSEFAQPEALPVAVPEDSRYSVIDVRMQEAGICSETTGSSSERTNWCIIARNIENNFVSIKNTSTSTILVDGTTVSKQEAVDIKDGSKIISGPNTEEYLHYTFKMLGMSHNEQKLTISLDVDHSKCSICLNIWHDVVTVAPCLHNFCNGCFSEWLRRSQKNNQTVQCPQCRASILSVGKNHFLYNIEEAIVRSFPSLKRSDEELAQLNKYASVQSNLVLSMRKTTSRKRHLPPVYDGNDMDIQCPQCAVQQGGFRCSPTIAHLQCHGCGGMMPSRLDISVPQICIGCDRAFCGAYWNSQSVNFGDIDRMCTRETFKSISERIVFRIPETTHQNNCHEQAITERCIQMTGKPLQVVISEYIVKFNNRELDRTRMSLKHADTISPQTYLCTDCYHKFISYLLYWFRLSLPNSRLPPDASNRENCWYGYACRTQHHNDEHARRRNHVCRPTRSDPNSSFPS